MDIDLTPWRGRRVCIALSGGGDSVALFDWCVRHAAANSITLSAVHVEHGIRGRASPKDAAVINTLCARWLLEQSPSQRDKRQRTTPYSD